MIRGGEFEKHIIKSNGLQSSLSHKKVTLLNSGFAGDL